MGSTLTAPTPQGLEAFGSSEYRIVRPLFSFRRVFRVFDSFDRLVVYVEHPLFRLRDEWILYADEGGLQALLVVKLRRLAAFNSEHDVLDAQSGQRLGTLRSRALKSIVRDAWEILGPDEQPAGEMLEEGHSWLRRLIPLLPSEHRIELGGRTVARLRQRFHLFSREFGLRVEQTEDPVDPRFLIACALVACQAELRRERR